MVLDMPDTHAIKSSNPEIYFLHFALCRKQDELIFPPQCGLMCTLLLGGTQLAVSGPTNLKHNKPPLTTACTF